MSYYEFLIKYLRSKGPRLIGKFGNSLVQLPNNWRVGQVVGNQCQTSYHAIQKYEKRYSKYWGCEREDNVNKCSEPTLYILHTTEMISKCTTS